jgi:hypothetical protein
MSSNTYSLSDVNPRVLRDRLFTLIEEEPWILKGWPTCKEVAYKMYKAEYKFGTLLLSIGRNESSKNDYIYAKCQQDLKKAHLYLCLLAWLRSPEDDWTWLKDRPHNTILGTLNYSLAWNTDVKGFLVATRDLLGLESVILSREYEQKSHKEAERCVEELFKFLAESDN